MLILLVLSSFFAVSQSQLSVPQGRQAADKETLGGIRDYAFSKSGELLATLSENGNIVVWNVKSKKALAVCKSAWKSKGKRVVRDAFSGATSLCFGGKDDETLFFPIYEALNYGIGRRAFLHRL